MARFLHHRGTPEKEPYSGSIPRVASTLKKRPSLFLRLVNRTLSDNRSHSHGHSHAGYQRIPNSATAFSWAGAAFSRLTALGNFTALGDKRANSALLQELCRYFGSDDEVKEQLALSIAKKTEDSVAAAAVAFIHHPINPYILPRRQSSVLQRNSRLSSANGTREVSRRSGNRKLLKLSIGAGELSLEGKRVASAACVMVLMCLQTSWCQGTSLRLFGRVPGLSPSAGAPGRAARSALQCRAG